MRTATIERKTKETDISVSLDLDGTGKYDVSTGVGFLDHMLEQLSRHSLMDLTVGCKASLLQVKQPLSHHLTHGCDLKGVFPLLCLQR